MKQCAVCEKGSRMGGKRILLRGHYNPTSTSRKYPNLQWMKVDGVRQKVCTNCMKKQTKKAVVRKSKPALSKVAVAAVVK